MINVDNLEASLQREQQRAAELAYLYQYALDLMTPTDGVIDTICRIVPETMRILLDADNTAVLLCDENDPTALTSRAQLGEFPDALSFGEHMLMQQRALVVSSASGSYLGMPLGADAPGLGVLAVHRGSGRAPFSDNEIQLITLLGGVTATALINDRLRQRLSERLSVLQTVMESSPSGLAILENGRLLTANPAALHALHLDSAAFDQPLTLNGPDGLFLERLNEALPPAHNTSFEYRVNTERRPRTLRIDVVPVGTNKLLAQINDITLLREIEMRRDEAVASTSHELKTPLAVMNLGLSNLLSYYEQMPDEDRRTMIEETLEQVGQMKYLISGLLDQRHKNKKVAPRNDSPPEVSDPGFYIGQVVNELSAFARYHGVALRWYDPSEALPRVQCSVPDLKMIVRNLVTNAIKYTPDGGDVTVWTENDAQTFRLAVTDTGVGIPETELEAIFERAYRASTRGDAEGNGLGLTLIRDIVTRFGGAVQVRSVVGTGSTFIVSLPSVA